MMITRTALLLSLLALAACRDDRPPAPTATENAQMDDAANMLDDLAENEAAPPR